MNLIGINPTSAGFVELHLEADSGKVFRTQYGGKTLIAQTASIYPVSEREATELQEGNHTVLDSYLQPQDDKAGTYEVTGGVFTLHLEDKHTASLTSGEISEAALAD